MSYIDIQRTDRETVVVYATSCSNPLSDMEQLSNELSHTIQGSCNILFDLLLSNGDSYNRFVMCKFDGTTIVRESIDIINEECLELNYRKCILNHYNQPNKINFMNSALSKYDVGRIIRKYQRQL